MQIFEKTIKLCGDLQVNVFKPSADKQLTFDVSIGILIEFIVFIYSERYSIFKNNIDKIFKKYKKLIKYKNNPKDPPKISPISYTLETQNSEPSEYLFKLFSLPAMLETVGNTGKALSSYYLDKFFGTKPTEPKFNEYSIVLQKLCKKIGFNLIIINEDSSYYFLGSIYHRLPLAFLYREVKIDSDSKITELLHLALSFQAINRFKYNNELDLDYPLYFEVNLSDSLLLASDLLRMNFSSNNDEQTMNNVLSCIISLVEENLFAFPVLIEFKLKILLNDFCYPCQKISLRNTFSIQCPTHNLQKICNRHFFKNKCPHCLRVLSNGEIEPLVEKCRSCSEYYFKILKPCKDCNLCLKCIVSHNCKLPSINECKHFRKKEINICNCEYSKTCLECLKSTVCKNCKKRLEPTCFYCLRTISNEFVLHKEFGYFMHVNCEKESVCYLSAEVSLLGIKI